VIVRGSGIYSSVLTEEAGLRADFMKNEGLKMQNRGATCFRTPDRDRTVRKATNFPPKIGCLTPSDTLLRMCNIFQKFP
jgi:hypothetical protein